MKIKCEKCGEDLSIQVDQRFEQFTIGRLECPHCKKKQSRWLTQADLMIYLGVSCLLYIIFGYILMYTLNDVGIKWYTIVISLVIYVLLYIVLKSLDRTIYTKAPFKKEWMNNEIYEDSAKVKKSMRYKYAIFLGIIIMVGTGNYPISLFVAVTVGFTTFIIVKTIFLLRNEKTSTKL